MIGSMVMVLGWADCGYGYASGGWLLSLMMLENTASYSFKHGRSFYKKRCPKQEKGISRKKRPHL